MAAQSHRLTIDRLSYGPAGIGRLDGKVVFVPGTVPGDTVEVVIEEDKKTYAVARLVSVQQPSAQRRQAPCPYIPRCGGCPWQHIHYAEQLRAKQALVEEHMRRIGGLTEPPVLPIIPSPQEWHYRHRIRLRTEPPARLGFYQARSHDLVEIESCRIAGETSPQQLQTARQWLAALRTVVRRLELLSGEARPGPEASRTVLVGNAEGPFQAADAAACRRFLNEHPELGGLVLFGRGWRREWGEVGISLDLGVDNLSLSVSSGVFTQVNLAGNRTLIETVLRIGDFSPHDRVIELYCGAGNLSLPLASRVESLIGIEQDRVAVANARANAARLGFTTLRFVHAPVRQGIDTLLDSGQRADVLVLDPSRAGAADIIDRLPQLGARKIVYVSCDPTTLARDLRRLGQHRYQLATLQPIDLFPHTYHVETVALAVLT
jgi:23S rRNA (uracil1939-C5)-methyltransferase